MRDKPRSTSGPVRGSGQRRNLAARLGGWSTRHRKTAVLGWLLFVVLAATVGGMTGTVQPAGFESEVGDSARAAKILHDAGIEEPADEAVMVSSPTRDGWRQAAGEVVAGIRATGEARTGTVKAPLPAEDGKAGLVSFQMKGDPEDAGDRVQPVLDAVQKVRGAHDEVTIDEYGDASGDKWLGEMLGEDFARAEWTAVPLALGILLVAFGALVAALLPVALAMTAFVAASGLLALVSHQLHIFETTGSVMLLMGLAVGVDYCLFYLRRERDERAAGRDPETALRIAAATSGRAVLVSGLTVMVAMAGMFLSGLLLFKGFAVATILVVFIAMLGSVTILPALLSWLGDRVEKGRLPFLGGRKRTRDGSGVRRRASGRISGAVLRPVLRAPGLFAVVAAVAMLVLAAPALGMKTESLALDKQMPAGSPLRVGSERINKTFPGGPAPANVVLKADDIGSPAVREALADFTAQARRSDHFGKGVETTVHKAQNVAEIGVPLAGDGTDATSRAALDELRDSLIPDTLAPVAAGTGAQGGAGDEAGAGTGDGTREGPQVYVTGPLASSVDFNDQLRDGIVPVFVFITVVTFLLMLVCFRSVPVAVASILLNLLSVGAAYGVMTAVFQHGWGAGLLGTEAVGAIEAWMPLFVLVILFGLSMDYHVFVVSRIREARDRGVTTRQAVREGIRSTAGAVTGAAAIMVAVFAVFATLSMQDMKQMGVGLAVAVLLDATVVRMVLLPAVLALLGERSWYLPRWLGWLPRLGHGEQGHAGEQPQEAAAAATGAGAGADGGTGGGMGYAPAQEPPVRTR